MDSAAIAGKGRELVIETRGLERTYGAGEALQAALRGVHFQVARGEMVAIMGPSGCGKTTLLNCISGLDTPTAGEVILAGRSLRELHEPELTRHRARSAGFIFQAYNLIPVLTVEENVMLPLLTRDVGESKARPIARAVLDQLGLAGFERRLPLELSGGEQQRVAIARALAPNPAVIFADEPTGNLDAARSRSLLDLLTLANRERGQTFVIVTHDPDVAGRCGRIVQMQDGRILAP